MADLSRKRERERLPVRREPHWHRLAEGAYLGFRRGPDTWVARHRGRDGHEVYKALKDASDFDSAKAAAEAWIAQVAGSKVRTAKRDTVKAALEGYLADLRRHGRADAAREAEWRFKLTVYKDAIAEVSLEDANRDDFLEWRDRLLPGRQHRSINRHVRAVVAGLNWAAANGYVANPAAWHMKPLADDVDDEGATAVFLNAAQRRAIIAAAAPAVGEFMRGLELTGARPKELAAAKVSDFDGRTLRLAHRKGRPPKVRARQVVLSREGVAFFESMTRGKLPAAPILTEDGQTSWRRHIWAREIRAAVVAHNKKAEGSDRAPPTATAYSFRHARISELLQLHGVDPLTVASQTGTSLAMIEKAYLKFIPSALADKLSALREAK